MGDVSNRLPLSPLQKSGFISALTSPQNAALNTPIHAVRLWPTHHTTVRKSCTTELNYLSINAADSDSNTQLTQNTLSVKIYVNWHTIQYRLCLKKNVPLFNWLALCQKFKKTILKIFRCWNEHKVFDKLHVILTAHLNYHCLTENFLRHTVVSEQSRHFIQPMAWPAKKKQGMYPFTYSM